MALSDQSENKALGSSHYLPPKKQPSPATGDFLKEALENQIRKVENLPATEENWPEFKKLSRLSRLVSRRNAGFGAWWPLVFATTCMIVVVGWLAGRTSRTYFFHYPESVLRVVQNLDPCLPDGSCGKRYLIQSVIDGQANPETEMHFSEPQHFEAGHTFAWIRYRVLGSEVVTDGWDVLKGSDGLPVLPPNCSFDWSTPKGHVICEGGKAKF